MKRLPRIACVFSLSLFSLVLAPPIAHCAEPPPTQSMESQSAVVSLTGTFHSAGVGGDVVALPPGVYLLATGPQLGELVITDAAGVQRTFPALSASHEEKLDNAYALVVSVGEDERRLVLLLPEGKRLEAIGSATGVSSRGALARPTPVSSDALQAALAAEPSTMRSSAPTIDPTARIAVSPSPDALRVYRQPAGPAATAQDMRIFGTPIVEFPAPILTPAPGSYQASCSNVSQIQIRRQGSPWTMTTLSAQCRNRAGIMLPTRLNDPHNCAGDISNDDGALRCVRAQPAVMGRLLFPLPPGSWQQSCRDAYFQMESHEVRAQCRTIASTWRDTTLNTFYPCASVSNSDGWLSCDAAPLPGGPWRGHCKEASIPQPGLGFAAICRRASDGVWQRTSVGDCGSDVDVLDGFLTCGLISGLPTGKWVDRCRPVNWDANEPAITLICRNNDQTLKAWRVTLGGCTPPLSLDYDGVSKFTCP